MEHRASGVCIIDVSATTMSPAAVSPAAVPFGPCATTSTRAQLPSARTPTAQPVHLPVGQHQVVPQVHRVPRLRDELIDMVCRRRGLCTAVEAPAISRSTFRTTASTARFATKREFVQIGGSKRGRQGSAGKTETTNLHSNRQALDCGQRSPTCTEPSVPV